MFLVLLGVVISAFIIILPPYVFGETKTLDTLIEEGNLLKQSAPSLKVGEGPYEMGFHYTGDILYVANSESDTVSVIDLDTMTASNITVGDRPTSIAVDDINKILYVTNSESYTVSVIDSRDNNLVRTITVGDQPRNIEVDYEELVYVANEGSDTVSVINGTYPYNSIKNITVVSPIDVELGLLQDVFYVASPTSDYITVFNGTYPYSSIKNITVSSPIDIEVGYDVFYVANFNSGNVSVFDSEDFSPIMNITVADAENVLTDIEVEGSDNLYSDVLYVANLESNTVSVFNGTEHFNGTEYDLIGNISTTNPSDIEVAADVVYVANSRVGDLTFDTVTVFNKRTQKVLAGASFDVNPFHAGRINCNNATVPINQYIYVDFRTQCKAEANEGFRFSSWIQNLEGNSSRIISSSKAPDLLDFVLNPLLTAIGRGPNDAPANLPVTQFGSFTANFEELPPPLPPEYWGTLFGVVATALVGTWLIPSVIGWTKSKRQHRSLRQYRKKISLMNNNKVEFDTPDKLKSDITTAYSNGKINELQHEILKGEISQFHQKAFSKTINSIKMSDRESDQYIKTLDKFREHLKDAYSERKIDSEYYRDLENETSGLYEELYRKRIDSLAGLPIRHYSKDDRLINKIKSDIEDAFVKGKITDQHYSMLNGKIDSYEQNK